MRLELNEDPEVKEQTGLKDAGHVFLSCSSCGKNLVDIWRINPDEIVNGEPVIWKVKAKCHYCGDSSFVKEIVGRHADQGIYNGEQALSLIDRIEEVNGVYIYHTMKG